MPDRYSESLTFRGTTHEAGPPFSVELTGAEYLLICEALAGLSARACAPWEVTMAFGTASRLAAAQRASGSTSSPGVDLIAAERRRQVEVEGWTPEHDADHCDGELVQAAVAYAAATDDHQGDTAGDFWPWDLASWKPSDDKVRNLVKAGALIAAEIDRQRRRG